MEVSLLLGNLRSRRERLRSQVAKCKRELDEITTTIGCLERELAKPTVAVREEPPGFFDGCEMPGLTGADPAPALKAPEAEPEPSISRHRPSLAARRAVLMEYLAKHGPSTRGAILSATDIPAGSLSALLARGGEEGWLRKTTKGEWMLPTK